jgi:hypothetical protein
MALEPITLSEEELRALDDKVPTGTKVYAKDSEEDLIPTSEELSAEAEAREEASLRELESMSRPQQELDPKIAYALGDHPGLESIKLTDDEVKQVVAAAYAQPSGWEKAWYGARTTGGLVENTARFLTRAALAATGDETWESAGELSRMSRRERGKSASLATALRPDLQDDTSVVAGMIGGAVADPTSLIALAPKAMTSLVGGRATLAAVLTGAGLGGGDALMAQAAHEDEIDWGMVGGAALLGGGIGGILHAAGSAIANRFAKTLDDKSRAGVPITMDDAQRIIDEAEIQGTARRMDDPRLGMEANRVDYDDVIEGEVVVPEARRTADSIGMERNRVEGGSPIEGEFYEIMENAGKLRNEVAQAITEKNPSRLLGLLRKANPYPITDNLSKRILKEENGFNPFSSVADEEVEYLRRNYGLPDKVEQ